jgi:tetratricopeptide (TPR) repeat protein
MRVNPADQIPTKTPQANKKRMIYSHSSTGSREMWIILKTLPKIPFVHAASFAGVCLLLVNSAGAADRVYPKDGVPATGKIQSLSPTQVVIAVRGKNQTYAMSDVLKIAFDGEPRELERGRDLALQGQYDQALEEIKKITAGAAKSQAVTEDILFYRWYCEGKLSLTGGGDKAAAIKGLRALAGTNRNTHHLFDVGEMLGELHLAIGKPAEASSFFSVMLKAADDVTKARGVYQLGMVELSQNKNEEARKRFTQLSGAASSSAEMKRLQNLSKVGIAICDQRAGKAEDALKRLDNLVAATESSDQQLYARISNAKGACYAAMNKPTEALFHYLQTDLLFFGEADAHAEALYHLKQLWTQYGNPTKAAEAGRRLATQYATSSWAQL